MLNKIFISHWKITLILSTLGLITWAVVAALYWIPPVARLIEVPISLEELLQSPSATGPKKIPMPHVAKTTRIEAPTPKAAPQKQAE
jgi:hypothetical protein